MTFTIYEDWLRKLDKCFKMERGKILLIMTVTQLIQSLPNWNQTQMFLPLNATSQLNHATWALLRINKLNIVES
jgi:hypothetical protein